MISACNSCGNVNWPGEGCGQDTEFPEGSQVAYTTDKTIGGNSIMLEYYGKDSSCSTLCSVTYVPESKGKVRWCNFLS